MRRAGTLLLLAALFLSSATPAGAIIISRIARFPEPLWDITYPADVVADGTGAMWVADRGNLRTVLLDQSGRELTSIRWDGKSIGVAVCDDGSVWTSSGDSEVRHFARSGKLLTTITLPNVGGRNWTESAGIDVDGEGNVYVADKLAGAVYKHGPDGTRLDVFGQANGMQSARLGEFGEVIDVSVDASGAIWTAEAYGQRIQKLGPDGAPLLAFAPKDSAGNVLRPTGMAPLPGDQVVVSGSGKLVRTDSTGRCLQTYFDHGQLRTTGDVSVGSDGRIYWADRGSGFVRIFSAEGEQLGAYSRKTHYREQFTEPRAVAVSDDDRIAVAQSSYTVQYLRMDGSTIGTFDLPTTIADGGNRGLAFDATGRLWVADDKTGGLYSYTPQGQLLRVVGGFWSPNGVGIAPSGDIYVSDSFNRLAKRLDSEANLLGSWQINFAQHYVFRQNLAVDDQGDVFVTQQSTVSNPTGISRYDSTGKLEAFWKVDPAGDRTSARLAGIAVAPDGSVWVCEPGSPSIQRFTRDGVLLGRWTGPIDEPLVNPEGIAFDSQGNLWVADKSKNTVEGYSVKKVDFVGVAGASRYATAVEASKEAFPDGAECVVIATGSNWPDALGGGALAAAKGGPILLTQTNTLPSEVLAEIERLGATKAFVLGGEAAVGRPVLNALKAKLGTSNVTRIGGAGRYETAELIAEATATELGAAYDGTVFVATGGDFPDALGASPLAAAKGWPLLLSGPTGLSAGTLETLDDIGATKVLLLGGDLALPVSVEVQVAGRSPERLEGTGRYGTAHRIAQYGVANAGLSWDRVALATGENFPDALAGGVLQGLDGSVMLLTPGDSLHAEPTGALRMNKASIRTVRFLGGESAIKPATRAQAQALLE